MEYDEIDAHVGMRATVAVTDLLSEQTRWGGYNTNDNNDDSSSSLLIRRRGQVVTLRCGRYRLLVQRARYYRREMVVTVAVATVGERAWKFRCGMWTALYGGSNLRRWYRGISRRRQRNSLPTLFWGMVCGGGVCWRIGDDLDSCSFTFWIKWDYYIILCYMHWFRI